MSDRYGSIARNSSLEVITRSHALEALKMSTLRYEVQKHDLIPFHVKTVVILCEAGERYVHKTVPVTKLKKKSIK
jgi:hypothetical protein